MKIVIVGGGFGGVRTARLLAQQTKHHITLISDKPQFQYFPSLYGAATGRSANESWFSLATLFADVPRVKVVIDTVASIEPSGRYVVSESGVRYDYDRCVLALGSVTTFFGIPGLDKVAFGMKSHKEIGELKQHIYNELLAERPLEERAIMVVGGGPTGVEMAASLGAYIREVERRLGLRHQGYKIHLIEAAPRVLPTMHPGVSKHVKKRLEKLDVRVRVDTKVESATSKHIVINGKKVTSRTTLWTSGVATNPFYKQNQEKFEFSKNGKIVVNDFLQSSRYIYVLGDNAFTPFSGLAQIATRHADFLVHNFVRLAADKRLKRYKTKTPPIVIPVGEKWAVFAWGPLRLYGWIPSLLRKAADVVGYSELLGLRRALAVLQWSEPFEDEYFLYGSQPKN